MRLGGGLLLVGVEEVPTERRDAVAMGCWLATAHGFVMGVVFGGAEASGGCAKRESAIDGIGRRGKGRGVVLVVVVVIRVGWILVMGTVRPVREGGCTLLVCAVLIVRTA